MDQLGHPVDPAARTGGPPDVRLAAWVALAARTDALGLVPTQSARSAL